MVEFTAAGAPVGTYTFAGVGGLRGVYELPGGSLLVTNGNGIYEVRRDGTVVRQIVAGVQGRFIEEFAPGGIVAGEAAAPAGGAALRVAGGNPFRLQTTLTADRPQAVRVAAYDVTGRRVATLFDGRLAVGTAQVLTLHGSGLPAGVHAVRATGETFAAARTVTHVE